MNSKATEVLVKVPAAPPGPPARGKPRRAGLGWLLLAALVTVAGLLAAAGYMRWRSPVTSITVHFQDAQGLHAGADLRYRGVTIGRVTDVDLLPDLGGVDVRIALTAQARAITRKGSRFWIVRPTISMTSGISGLETAVGDRYVAVHPSPQGELVDAFDGEEDPPPADLAFEGDRYKLRVKRELAPKVRAGAPVVCCGVNIGRIRKVDLAEDGQGVIAEIRIQKRHARLVRENSQFVGLTLFDPGMNFGAGGLSFSPQINLQAAGGGVELVVPPQLGPEVEQGHEFTLFDKVKPELFTKAGKE